jgi:hypothetical protein
MPDNTPYSDLKAAILELEKEKAVRKQVLEDQFKLAYQGLNPFNWLKNSIIKISESSEIKRSLLNFSFAILGGIFRKKVPQKIRRNPVLRLAGSFAQSSLTTILSRHPELIKMVALYIFRSIHKKRTPVNKV